MVYCYYYAIHSDSDGVEHHVFLHPDCLQHVRSGVISAGIFGAYVYDETVPHVTLCMVCKRTTTRRFSQRLMAKPPVVVIPCDCEMCLVGREIFDAESVLCA